MKKKSLNYILLIINIIIIILIIRTVYKTTVLHKRTVEILEIPTQTKIAPIDFQQEENTDFLNLIATKSLFGAPSKPKLQAILGPAALIDNEWHALNTKNTKTNLTLLHINQSSVIMQDDHSTMTLEMFSVMITKGVLKNENTNRKNKRTNNNLP